MTSTKPTEKILEVLGNWGAFSGVRWSVQPQTPKYQMSMSFIVPCKGVFECWDIPILDTTLSGQRLLLGYPCCNSLSFFSPVLSSAGDSLEAGDLDLYVI